MERHNMTCIYSGDVLSMNFPLRRKFYSIVKLNRNVKRCTLKIFSPRLVDDRYMYCMELKEQQITTNLNNNEPVIKMIVWTCNMTCKDTFTSRFKRMMDLHDPEIVIIFDVGLELDSYENVFRENGFVNLALIDSSGNFDGAGLIWKDRDLELSLNKASGTELKLTMTRT